MELGNLLSGPKKPWIQIPVTCNLHLYFTQQLHPEFGLPEAPQALFDPYCSHSLALLFEYGHLCISITHMCVHACNSIGFIPHLSPDFTCVYIRIPNLGKGFNRQCRTAHNSCLLTFPEINQTITSLFQRAPSSHYSPESSLVGASTLLTLSLILLDSFLIDVRRY